MFSTRQYLLGYNTLSGALWGSVLIKMVTTWINTDIWLGKEANLVNSVAPYTSKIQLLSVLEIAHVGLGLVRSNTLVTSMQVLARLINIYVVACQFPVAVANPAFPTMILAWSLSELVRYPYYFCQLKWPGQVPKWLEWLRYNAFIVLFPVGLVTESIMVYSAIPEATAKSKWLGKFLWFALYTYTPAFFVLYSHMFKMRRKHQ